MGNNALKTGLFKTIEQMRTTYMDTWSNLIQICYADFIELGFSEKEAFALQEKSNNVREALMDMNKLIDSLKKK